MINLFDWFKKPAQKSNLKNAIALRKAIKAAKKQKRIEASVERRKAFDKAVGLALGVGVVAALPKDGFSQSISGSLPVFVGRVATVSALPSNSIFQSIFVDDYSAPGDAGGGYFRKYSSLPSGYLVDNGLVFQSGSIYWIRQCDISRLNVAWYGIKPNVSVDCATTLATMKATLISLNYTGNLSAGIILFNTGNYYLSNFNLASGIRVEGAGSQSTIIYAYTATLSAAPGVFTIPPGPVDTSGLKGFSLFGGVNGNNTTNIGQHGLYFYAYPDSSSTGGLWYSIFEDLVVQWFSGYQIALRGGIGVSPTVNCPHQWLIFKMVRTFNYLQSTFTANISGGALTTLNVTTTPSIPLSVGMQVYNSGITNGNNGLASSSLGVITTNGGGVITAQTSGTTGGIGTYTITAVNAAVSSSSFVAVFLYSRSFIATGQTQHITHDCCQYDGYDIANVSTTPATVPSSVNIEISREYLNPSVISNASGYCGASIGGTNSGSNSPDLMTFNQVTCQSNAIACYSDLATAIVFVGGDFEHIYGCFYFNVQCQFSFKGLNFGNCSASYPAGQGFTYYFNNGGTQISYENMFYDNTTIDNYVVNNGGATSNGRFAKNNRFAGNISATATNNLDTYLSGGTIQIAATSPNINLTGNSIPYVGNTYLINGPLTGITQINSFLETGDNLFFKSFGGSITYVAASSGTQNIYLDGNVPQILVPNGQTVQFVRFDTGSRWQLVGGIFQFSIGEFTAYSGGTLPSASSLPDGVWCYVTNAAVTTGTSTLWGLAVPTTGTAPGTTARYRANVSNGVWIYG